MTRQEEIRKCLRGIWVWFLRQITGFTITEWNETPQGKKGQVNAN